MPQHPKYSNSPKRDLDRLSELLDEMDRYGLLHDDTHQSLDAVMAQLHPEATRRLLQLETGNEDGEEDLQFVPGVTALFHYVDPREQPQFIQDFRNLIAHWLYSDTWSTAGVAEAVRGERNMDHYRQHVMLVEDTETLERYAHARRTTWFPSAITPPRAGAYEISPTEHDPKHSGFAYWDGTQWYASRVLLADCLAQPRVADELSRWDYCWRGLVTPHP